ncbi:thioredoxin-like protein [Echria macrotheca]|uniref:Thioredoxin-like protein n=1 Tax=Echria macrotheca TaxID=438768 RepID=A0AAJ0F7M2_9PEZI|nr:thioredoxin-like protein [Echria macrotheca]
MSDSQPIHIPSLSALTDLSKTHKYILIDFWADWCPPCKAIAPMFSALAKKHGVPDALAFAKVDVEEAPEITQQFGITAMPTFLLLVDGEPGGIDVNDGVKSLGGGAVVGPDGKFGMIRGADPRNLTLLAEKLHALAAPAPAAEEEEGEA